MTSVQPIRAAAAPTNMALQTAEAWSLFWAAQGPGSRCLARSPDLYAPLDAHWHGVRVRPVADGPNPGPRLRHRRRRPRPALRRAEPARDGRRPGPRFAIAAAEARAAVGRCDGIPAVRSGVLPGRRQPIRLRIWRSRPEREGGRNGGRSGRPSVVPHPPSRRAAGRRDAPAPPRDRGAVRPAYPGGVLCR